MSIPQIGSTWLGLARANSIRLGAFWIGLTVASLLGWTPTALGRQALDMQDVYLG